MVEQVAVNDKVRGSSPLGGARHKSAPGYAVVRSRFGTEEGAVLYPPQL